MNAGGLCGIAQFLRACERTEYIRQRNEFPMDSLPSFGQSNFISCFRFWLLYFNGPWEIYFELLLFFFRQSLIKYFHFSARWRFLFLSAPPAFTLYGIGNIYCAHLFLVNCFAELNFVFKFFSLSAIESNNSR